MIGLPSSPRASRLGPLLLPIVLVFTGCVRQTTDGSETVFRYEFWVPISVLLAGIVAAPAGWLIRKRVARLGWTLLILGPIAVLAIAPSLFSDKVTLDEGGFKVQTGLWGMTSVHDVRFDEVRSLKIISETTSGRRKRTNYYFLCEMKAGEPRKVPINNEIAKAAAGPILRSMAARGIPIVEDL